MTDHAERPIAKHPRTAEQRLLLGVGFFAVLRSFPVSLFEIQLRNSPGLDGESHQNPKKARIGVMQQSHPCQIPGKTGPERHIEARQTEIPVCTRMLVGPHDPDCRAP